jgi:hypothetical protein
MNGLSRYGSIGGEAEDLLAELSVSGPEEIVGYDTVGYDVVGYHLGEMEEIVGAMPPSPARNAALIKARQARMAAAKRPVAGSNVEVVPQTNRRHRLMICGFGQTVVALGAQAVITVQPQRLFKPKLLSIPSSIAVFFRIDTVFVGQDSQLAAAGGIPCECFSEVAVNAPIDWDTANVGNTMTITVTNIEPAGGAVSRTFMGMLIGLGIKP